MAIAKAGGIPPLVALVRNGNDAQKANAAGALAWLGDDDNKIAIAKAGGIPLLVALWKDGTDMQKGFASRALESIAANCPDNKILIAKAERELVLASITKACERSRN